MKHKVLDLFAGIGGFSLGLERTGGFETVAMCEKDEKAQLVLRKHWPDTPIYDDIKELTGERLQADGIVPTVITGGFPCQDISGAGKGAGIIGERSGLWAEMFRLVRDVRPSWAIIENVSALRSKGLTLVLQNLCSIGYCVEWHCVPATAVGAPHRRDRIWIVAYPMCEGSQGLRPECGLGEGGSGGAESRGSQGNAERERSVRGSGGSASQDVADAAGQRREGPRPSGDACYSTPPIQREAAQLIHGGIPNEWGSEPDVGRVAHGVPNRVDRLKQLGNAVVPQIPQLIGQAILSAESIHRGNQ